MPSTAGNCSVGIIVLEDHQRGPDNFLLIISCCEFFHPGIGVSSYRPKYHRIWPTDSVHLVLTIYPYYHWWLDRALALLDRLCHFSLRGMFRRPQWALPAVFFAG